jgi:hypothetical protein
MEILYNQDISIYLGEYDISIYSGEYEISFDQNKLKPNNDILKKSNILKINSFHDFIESF